VPARVDDARQGDDRQVVQIVDREAFYQADHQIIFDILVKLYEQNRPIDASSSARS
jgi:replicative DNA helicase